MDPLRRLTAALERLTAWAQQNRDADLDDYDDWRGLLSATVAALSAAGEARTERLAQAVLWVLAVAPAEADLPAAVAAAPQPDWVLAEAPEHPEWRARLQAAACFERLSMSPARRALLQLLASDTHEYVRASALLSMAVHRLSGVTELAGRTLLQAQTEFGKGAALLALAAAGSSSLAEVALTERESASPELRRVIDRLLEPTPRPARHKKGREIDVQG